LKRNATLTLTITLAAMLLLVYAGINYFIKPQENDLPFRCSTFSNYNLSHQNDKKIEFSVSQDLRFINSDLGYLLLNGQVIFGNQVTTLNRRIALSAGKKIDRETYRYKIRSIIPASNDTTPDAVFNLLLAEITLDPGYLQLDMTQVDNKTYMIGGPLSVLFTCQRY